MLGRGSRSRLTWLPQTTRRNSGTSPPLRVSALCRRDKSSDQDPLMDSILAFVSTFASKIFLARGHTLRACPEAAKTSGQHGGFLVNGTEQCQTVILNCVPIARNESEHQQSNAGTVGNGWKSPSSRRCRGELNRPLCQTNRERLTRLAKAR